MNIDRQMLRKIMATFSNWYSFSFDVSKPNNSKRVFLDMKLAVGWLEVVIVELPVLDLYFLYVSLFTILRLFLSNFANII